MIKYLINENLHGYEKIDISRIDTTENSNNIFIIIHNKNCDNGISDYYKFVASALRHNNRVILVSVDDGNTSFKPLASLMIMYNAYDIYQVVQGEMISAPYLKDIEARTPDYTEVQTFIGGDVISSSDMSEILFAITSLVDEGNVEGLKAFVESRVESIENMTVALNTLKKTTDIFNSNELVDVVSSLKDKNSKLKKDIETKDAKLDEIKLEKEKEFVRAEDLKRENERLKSSNESLKAHGSGGAIIKSYTTLNTQLIKCKTKLILYFKEVSYVNYTNSLIHQLMTWLENKKLKVKLLIYDSNSELYQQYHPLPIVTGSDYLNMKPTLISKSKQFVVAEPNQIILEDIVTSELCFDVVIVYDKMHGMTDIVTGNNVTKFFVINSSKEYDNLKNQLKINDLTYVITNTNSSIGRAKTNGKVINNDSVKKYLDIPTIEGYNAQTESGKTSRYFKLATSSKVALIDSILDKSKVYTLVKK